MSELRHLVSTDSLEQLTKAKHLTGNPNEMHKTRFVKWLETKADQLYDQYLGAGMTPADALQKTQADLEDYTAEWKAAARAKAMR